MNAMNMEFSEKDNPGIFSRSPLFNDLSMVKGGALDPQEFVEKYRKHLTKGTMDNLLAYGMESNRPESGAFGASGFSKYRAQREMEMQKRRAQQGPVTPDEYNAMR